MFSISYILFFSIVKGSVNALGKLAWFSTFNKFRNHWFIVTCLFCWRCFEKFSAKVWNNVFNRFSSIKSCFPKSGMMRRMTLLCFFTWAAFLLATMTVWWALILNKMPVFQTTTAWSPTAATTVTQYSSTRIAVTTRQFGHYGVSAIFSLSQENHVWQPCLVGATFKNGDKCAFHTKPTNRLSQNACNTGP